MKIPITRSHRQACQRSGNGHKQRFPSERGQFVENVSEWVERRDFKGRVVISERFIDLNKINGFRDEHSFQVQGIVYYSSVIKNTQ